MSTTAEPEAPAVEPEHHDDDGGKEQLDEQLREEITPLKGATVVKAGGRTAKQEQAPAGGKRRSSKQRTKTSTKRATSTGTRAAAKPKAAAGGPKKVSAIKAAETILRRASGPLHVKVITERILAMPDTALKGKTPEASVGAILAVASKQKDSPFKRTAPSTYTLKEKK